MSEKRVTTRVYGSDETSRNNQGRSCMKRFDEKKGVQYKLLELRDAEVK